MSEPDPNDRQDDLLIGVKFVQKVVLFHPHKRWFLSLQRSHERPLYKGPWDLPGGKVKYGEDHHHAIQREILEETGLNAGVLHLQCLQTMMNHRRNIYYILVGYCGQALGTEVRLSDEHHAYQWLTAEDFLRLPSTPFLQHLVREVFKL